MRTVITEELIRDAEKIESLRHYLFKILLESAENSESKEIVVYPYQRGKSFV